MSKIEDTVVELIQKSVSSVEQGISWLSGELPDVIHQFLMWELAKHSIGIFLSLLPIILFIRSIIIYLKDYEEIQCKDDGTFMILIIVSGVFSIFAVGHFVCSIMNITQILIAPKIYLIEYAASLMK